MSQKKPEFSVIIPLYNHQAYVSEALNSVLHQTLDDIEVLVIDDGSTDGSGTIVQNYTDKRIKYFYQTNKGAAQAINRGIRLAQGNYIAVLNSDDVYHTHRLEYAFNIFKQDSNVQAIYTYIECIDEYSKSIGHYKDEVENWFWIQEDENVAKLPKRYRFLAGNTLYTTSNIICRTELFETVGLFEDFKYVHDYDFYCKICLLANVYVEQRVLLKYRMHSKNTLKADFAQSTLETAIVLSHHLSKILNEEIWDETLCCELMQSIYIHLNAYEAERLILSLLFGAREGNLYSVMRSEYAYPLRRILLERLKKTREATLANRDIAWQEKQTTLWWERAQVLEGESKWHKSQCDYWWERAQVLEEENAWHRSQCDYWWERAQVLEGESKWHKSQCDYWWVVSQQNQKELVEYKKRELSYVYRIAKKIYAMTRIFLKG